jgi:ferredoxin
VTSAPQPKDIGAGYQVPSEQRPAPRGVWLFQLDAVLLALTLVAASLVVHWGRRRWMATALAILCLAYFGLYRQGCVCPVGSLQNVSTALADPGYVVPFVVLAFFLMPLVAALVVGRVFCGGVCPLGAIQELVLLRPIQLPAAVDQWGGKLRYVYLALGVWFAVLPAPSRDFVICRFDPFVGIFRLTGPPWLIAVGVALLLMGTVVGRPYCRFLCPYGALLGLVSRFAWKPVRITPDDELDCGVCAEACPFNAIRNLRADPARCLACARCFAHCPRQQFVWGEIELHELETIAARSGQSAGVGEGRA